MTQIARWQHHEGDKVRESSFPLPEDIIQNGPSAGDPIYKGGTLGNCFSTLICKVNSMQGGWCEVVNDKGEVLRHHPGPQRGQEVGEGQSKKAK